MDNNILSASEDLLRRVERLDKFESKYDTIPYKEINRISREMKELANSLPDITHPTNQDELLKSELKRRLNGEAFSLDQRLDPQSYDFDTIVTIFDIPKQDISELRGWLLLNRNITLEAIERLYQTKDIQNYELGLPADIPSIRRQAEEFATIHVQKYHKTLGKLLQNLTPVGSFLRDINASPTTAGRSYFHPLTNTIAIGIPAICYTTEDGCLHIKEKNLIDIYGHEGMGHALNHAITKSNGLPYFLIKDTALTAATQESVAQFYQNVIFEDLKNSPETQRALGIEHKFGEIYQEAKDMAQLQEYFHRLGQYTTVVLADKGLGSPQDPETLDKKKALLNDVVINPKYASNAVESTRNSFDSQGNYPAGAVRELMYCAQPVKRALEEFAKQGVFYEGEGRSKIDATLLKGFWTPIGYVDNARLRAQGK
jgi:hypothetical protein